MSQPLTTLFASLLAASLSGCAGAAATDYYRFEEGNTWEYFVRNSELNDESWTLSILDGDENEQGGNGRFYFELIANWKDAVNPSIEYSEPRRRFNISPDFGGLGEDSDIVAWQYKQVNNDEGRRNENFAVAPGAGSDWMEQWDFRVSGSGGGSDFDYDFTASYSEESIQTSLATYSDTLHIARERTTTSNSGNGDQVLVNLREEWYAPNVGLVRYRDTGSDGISVEGVLRQTNVTESTEETEE